MSEPKFPTCEVVGTLIDFERGSPCGPAIRRRSAIPASRTARVLLGRA